MGVSQILSAITPAQGGFVGGDLIELAILFLILAVVAYVLGAREIAGVSMKVAKWLVIIFVVLAIVAVIL